MIDLQTLLTCSAFLAVALLYASTGQAGASGYIAIMALAGYEPESIKPTALVLNILVSLVVSWRFIRDGHFNWQLFWPFARPAVPMALLGGYITPPKAWFEYLLGALLLIAGTLSLVRRPSKDQVVRPPRKPDECASEIDVDHALPDPLIPGVHFEVGYNLLSLGLVASNDRQISASTRKIGRRRVANTMAISSHPPKSENPPQPLT
ncbi:sulfite exporter TauE/SafE family protein [Paraburkholderia sp. CNPSo 3274]|uniref:sulfite exporter TauE/SafE family protein n=1 Tax=Paraburkholderia sp. CNPSo 3274 TaxID=2940932 RepID=UPI0020B80239|nr:sulfite exporter TauE/SafE family protein [Paraburkholderia sp. CNPSo 3274]MCP3709457.1 sulfite exporter TauE/SafE family protein [Paraburkholderia sp. CNPSo 3274]